MWGQGQLRAHPLEPRMCMGLGAGTGAPWVGKGLGTGVWLPPELPSRLTDLSDSGFPVLRVSTRPIHAVPAHGLTTSSAVATRARASSTGCTAADLRPNPGTLMLGGMLWVQTALRGS